MRWETYNALRSEATQAEKAYLASVAAMAKRIRQRAQRSAFHGRRRLTAVAKALMEDQE